MVDAHIVVVENNQQVVGRGTDIVQSLKSQSATHGTVADDGYDMALGMSRLAGSHRHAQRGRDAVRRMTTSEGVVRTLFRRRERTHTTHLAVGAEGVSPTRQDLVAVGLMAHIPYDTVIGRVKDIVQCHGDLHHAKTGSEMSGVDRHFVDNILSELAAYLRQLVDAEFPQVGRIFDLTKKSVFVLIHSHSFAIALQRYNI